MQISAEFGIGLVRIEISPYINKTLVEHFLLQYISFLFTQALKNIKIFYVG